MNPTETLVGKVTKKFPSISSSGQAVMRKNGRPLLTGSIAETSNLAPLLAHFLSADIQVFHQIGPLDMQSLDEDIQQDMIETG